MDKIFVAKSYQDWNIISEPFKNEKGKLEVTVETKCPRCGGAGIIVARVENGVQIPIPVDGGICYQCRGDRKLRKNVRAYTEKEYNALERANERNREKRAEEMEAKRVKEFESKKKKWLEENGFNENGETYVYFLNDSYEIKETLKEDGFKFNKCLYWHTPEVKDEYVDKTFKVTLHEVAEISAWGTGNYKAEAKDYIEKKIFDMSGGKEGEWLGDMNDVGKNIEVVATLVSINEVNSRYGFTQIVKFVDDAGNNINWWTTVNIPYSIGTKLLIKGTIKGFDRYKNQKITLLKRCKLSEV